MNSRNLKDLLEKVFFQDTFSNIRHKLNYGPDLLTDKFIIKWKNMIKDYLEQLDSCSNTTFCSYFAVHYSLNVNVEYVIPTLEWNPVVCNKLVDANKIDVDQTKKLTKKTLVFLSSFLVDHNLLLQLMRSGSNQGYVSKLSQWFDQEYCLIKSLWYCCESKGYNDTCILLHKIWSILVLINKHRCLTIKVSDIKSIDLDDHQDQYTSLLFNIRHLIIVDINLLLNYHPFWINKVFWLIIERERLGLKTTVISNIDINTLFSKIKDKVNVRDKDNSFSYGDLINDHHKWINQIFKVIKTTKG